MIRIIVKLLVLAVTLATVSALQSHKKFSEGSCSNFHLHPAKASRSFVDSLHYVPAGSKYQMYRLACAMPNYANIREDEFYYDFCLTRNTTAREYTTAAGFGFGHLLNTFLVTKTRPGIYMEAKALEAAQNYDTIRQTVTLTDNKNFAFIVTCWTGSDTIGWSVATKTPEVDKRTEKMIMDHATSLGFNKEKFVFLRYDSCKKGGPFIDHHHHDDDNNHHDDNDKHHDDHHEDHHDDHHDDDHHDDHHDDDHQHYGQKTGEPKGPAQLRRPSVEFGRGSRQSESKNDVGSGWTSSN